MPKPVEFLGLSFVDLFAGAFGAILILYFIIPKMSLADRSYLETIKRLEVDVTRLEEIVGEMKDQRPDLYKLAISKLMELRKQIEELARENREKDQQIAKLEKRVDQLQVQLNKTSFIFFTIIWKTTKQDIDLWVIDPDGVLFNYRYREHSNHPGLISADSVEGPGVEAWIIVKPRPGTYRFYANLYDFDGNYQRPVVQPQVYTKYGLRNLQSRTISQAYKINEYSRENISLITPLGTITVTQGGGITVQ
jgi:hypothetical protein